jgi:serine phosphatase RsbU (regulator of sigma subunit)
MSLCTVCAALLTERDGTAVADIVCAGHPLPLLVADGHARPVGSFGPILGADADESWPRVTVTLDAGTLLVLYTDGVLDTVGDGGIRFGEDRLRQTVADAADAADVVARIDAALKHFEVGEQADDTAVLAVERVSVAGSVASPNELLQAPPVSESDVDGLAAEGDA